MKQLNMNEVQVKSLNSNMELFILDLTNINAEKCGIESIGDDFFSPSFSTLKTLNLTHNKIAKFPNVFDCTRLTVIKLGYNKIEDVPKELGFVVSLKTLELQGNNIKSVSDAVFKLPKLESIDLSGNQLTKVMEKGWEDTHLL